MKYLLVGIPFPGDRNAGSTIQRLLSGSTLYSGLVEVPPQSPSVGFLLEASTIPVTFVAAIPYMTAMEVVPMPQTSVQLAQASRKVWVFVHAAHALEEDLIAANDAILKLSDRFVPYQVMALRAADWATDQSRAMFVLVTDYRDEQDLEELKRRIVTDGTLKIGVVVSD